MVVKIKYSSLYISDNLHLLGMMDMLREITTEPMLILYSLFLYMARFTRQQFFESIICKNLGNSVQNISCDNVDKSDPSFAKISDKTEDLLSYLQLFETLIPLIVVVVVGPLSDVYGRKWFMLVNLVGCIFLPLGYFWLNFLENVPLWLLLVPSIPASLTGFDSVLFNTVYSYAGDASHGTSARAASIRFIIIDTLQNLFSPAGLYGGSFILRVGGYAYLFGISTGIVTVSVLYIAFCIPNIIPKKVTALHVEIAENRTLFQRVWGFFVALFSCVLERRSGYGRAVVNILLCILGIHSITYTCDNNVSFLFLQEKFGFDETSFADIQAIRMLLLGVGSLLLVAIINFTSLDVLIIGIIGTISRLAYYLEYSLADQYWVLNLGNILGSIGGTVPAACKIIIASIVEPAQLGKINTFVALLEALLPLGFVPVFDWVWRTTNSTDPGLSFLVTAGVLVIILILFCFVTFLRRGSKHERST